MQQLDASRMCDNTASFFSIGVVRPKKSRGSCSSDDLINQIASVAVSFSLFSSAAVLKSTNSNNVAILSVWKKDARLSPHIREERKDSTFSSRTMARLQSPFSKRSSKNVHPEGLPASLMIEFEKALRNLSHVLGMSWYEFSCGDCKELDPTTQLGPETPSRSLSTPRRDQALSRISSPSSGKNPTPVSRANSSYDPMGNVSSPLSLNSRQDLIENVASPAWSAASHSTLHEDSRQREYCAGSSSRLSFQPCSVSSFSMVPIGPVILSVGDTVHIRCVESGRSKTPLQDMLSYSCLAILRAYFPKTEGLRSYTFYRSLNGTKVAGLGVWQDAITASSFLNAPDGACEESFWRSMGATTRFEIYEVATLVE